MNDIILSLPELYLYPVFLVILLVTALLARETDPPVGEPHGTTPPTGRGVGDAPVAAGCNRDRAPLPGSIGHPGGTHGPFRDLEATLSVTYAARLEQALRTIRGNRLPGARPTDQAAW
jgi:hypothetical protein